MRYWKRIFVMLLLGGSSAIGAPPEGVIPNSLTPSSPVNNPGASCYNRQQGYQLMQYSKQKNLEFSLSPNRGSK
jgi:hypothetical protein